MGVLYPVQGAWVESNEIAADICVVSILTVINDPVKNGADQAHHFYECKRNTVVVWIAPRANVGCLGECENF